MNALAILQVAAAANHALPLAERSAVSEADWQAINRIASSIVDDLSNIERDATRIEQVRNEAGVQRSWLRSITQRSADALKTLPRSS